MRSIAPTKNLKIPTPGLKPLKGLPKLRMPKLKLPGKSTRYGR